MIDLRASDLRPFLPARDFALSCAFYEALGAVPEWADEGLALYRFAGSRFYLQRYYVEDWADNCMLHLTVADAAGCRDAIGRLLETGAFPGARVAGPKREAYGASVTHVWDPSGVLLHLAQWLDD